MTQSVKLGTVRVVLLASTLIPPFSNWRYPIAFACVGLSGLLGLLAAQQGSKWWLTIPGMIIGGLALGLYLGFHSF
jgi:fatty acid desaturase